MGLHPTSTSDANSIYVLYLLENDISTPIVVIFALLVQKYRTIIHKHHIICCYFWIIDAEISTNDVEITYLSYISMIFLENKKIVLSIITLTLIIKRP